MSALDFALGPSSEVVIVADEQRDDTAKMLQTLRNSFLPKNVTLLRSVKDTDEITRLANFTINMKSKDGKATAFVCRNHVCELPTTDPHVMRSLLDDQ